MSVFEQVDPWQASTFLPPGNHVVTIRSAEAGMSSGQFPQAMIEMSNNDGTIRDWITLTPLEKSDIGIRKIRSVFESAGVMVPQVGEYDPTTMAVSQTALNRLTQKQVGIIVREQPSYKDPSKTVERVMGYVPVEKVREMGKVANPPSTAPTLSGANHADDDDVPF